MKKILPKVYDTDQLFTFSGLDGKTAYSTMFTLVSRPERFTYAVVFPEEEGLIKIADTADVIIGNDFADFGPNRMLLADAWNLLIDGQAELSGFTGKHYDIAKRPGRILISVKNFARPELLDADFNALRDAKETQEFADMAVFPVETDDSATREAVTRAWEVLRACIYAPEEKFAGFWATPDRYPHRACWIMDSVYQSLGVRYFRPEVAQDQVLALLAHQCENGRVPMTAWPGGFLRASTQQPIIAQGVKATNIHGDKLRSIFPALGKYLDWLFMHRDCDSDGLLEWLMTGYPVCPCGESGMDNSPRFDDHIPLASVDLNCFVSLECEIMAEFAAELGLEMERIKWQKHHDELNALIEEQLWSDKLGIYCDRNICEDRLVEVSTVSGLMPLICGAASKERAAKLAALVTDPKAYGTPYPLPTVSVSDPKFQMDMWRGPVWHIFNYHIAEGLDRYGYHAEARIIREKTVEAGIRYAKEFGGFFEFYDPFAQMPPAKIPRKGLNSTESYHHAVHDYGWSAAIFVDMLCKINGKAF